MSNEEPQKQPNPLLSRVKLPGETHRLPSQAVFYTNGEISQDVKNGEIHIYPMTAIDEIIFRSPDKIFSGEAIKEVFSRCLPQVLDPMELFSKDIDFLMVCLKKVSYGDDTEIKYTHTCKDAKEHSYVIKMSGFIKSTKYMDPLKVREEYVIELENGQKVETRPLKLKHIIELAHSQEDLFSAERLLHTLCSIIRVVDEIEDVELIKEWLRVIPVSWATKISGIIEKASEWGPSFVSKLKCKDCNKTMEVSAPMNPLSFFLQ